MLKDDAIHNSSFRFRNIKFNNINDIYFAINIIVVIATTLFKTFIVFFILEFVIIIVINICVDVAIVIVIVFFVIVFKRLILKLIAFGFDIKDCFTMSALFDKS